MQWIPPAWSKFCLLHIRHRAPACYDILHLISKYNDIFAALSSHVPLICCRQKLSCGYELYTKIDFSRGFMCRRSLYPCSKGRWWGRGIPAPPRLMLKWLDHCNTADKVAIIFSIIRGRIITNFPRGLSSGSLWEQGFSLNVCETRHECSIMPQGSVTPHVWRKHKTTAVQGECLHRRTSSSCLWERQPRFCLTSRQISLFRLFLYVKGRLATVCVETTDINLTVRSDVETNLTSWWLSLSKRALNTLKGPRVSWLCDR